MRIWGMGCALLAVASCGGASQETRAESTTPREEVQPTSSVDSSAIPPEKFEEIDRFFKRKGGSLQFTCYDRVVEKSKTKFEGHLGFNLIVAPGGKVAKVNITDDTLKSPEIAECVIGEMKSWSWPDVPADAGYNGQVAFKPAW